MIFLKVKRTQTRVYKSDIQNMEKQEVTMNIINL